jgi:phosphoribosylaminoimidazole-succinocarboxamide synthase
MEALLTTDLPGLALFRRGKVRDTYRLSDDLLLFVTTDRMSAFDVVMPSGIPDKGKVLTGLSRFWFDRLRDLVPNHLVSCDVADLPPTLHHDWPDGGAHRHRMRGARLSRRFGLGRIPPERYGRGL